MGYISQENLVQNMTPEQRIMIAQFYAKFDIGSGIVNKTILNIEPLFYCGSGDTGELTIYNISKMYIGFSFFISGFNVSLNPGILYFYNELNAVNFTSQMNIGFFNVTNLYLGINTHIENISFSHIALSGGIIPQIKFIGYRVTLI